MGAERGSRIAVIDAMGRKLLQRDMSGTQLVLDLGALDPGPYLVLWMTREETQARRVVVN